MTVIPLERVLHDARKNHFVLTINNKASILEYEKPKPHIMDIISTYVPDSLRGEGLGTSLVAAAMEHAQQENLRVKASCPFAQEIIKQSPAYQLLLID